jgi:hypothetical protein
MRSSVIAVALLGAVAAQAQEYYDDATFNPQEWYDDDHELALMARGKGKAKGSPMKATKEAMKAMKAAKKATKEAEVAADAAAAAASPRKSVKSDAPKKSEGGKKPTPRASVKSEARKSEGTKKATPRASVKSDGPKKSEGGKKPTPRASVKSEARKSEGAKKAASPLKSPKKSEGKPAELFAETDDEAPSVVSLLAAFSISSLVGSGVTCVLFFRFFLPYIRNNAAKEPLLGA